MCTQIWELIRIQKHQDPQAFDARFTMAYHGGAGYQVGAHSFSFLVFPTCHLFINGDVFRFHNMPSPGAPGTLVL